MLLRVIAAATLLVAATAVPFPGTVAVAASITIAGNGPELPAIEHLVRAFERAQLGSNVQIRWDLSSRPVELVKSGEADFVVAGHEDPDLVAIPIAWDGIAVVVDFTNPVTEITTQQVAAMFSAKITQWSELGGPAMTIHLIDRPRNQHIRHTFEEVLGIVDQIPRSAKVIRSDQSAISTVAGNTSAVTYASLGVALEAVKYGVGVRLLIIDRVEAARETVKDGRYKLRRPVLLLRTKRASLVADAFAAFALSRAGQAIVDEMFVPYTAGEP